MSTNSKKSYPSYFPEELIIQILVRLPTKSLKTKSDFYFANYQVTFFLILDFPQIQPSTSSRLLAWREFLMGTWMHFVDGGICLFSPELLVLDLGLAGVLLSFGSRFIKWWCCRVSRFDRRSLVVGYGVVVDGKGCVLTS
ncbi:hypothetical protein Droror1_Dr00016104 [Drosera rotundifolia]